MKLKEFQKEFKNTMLRPRSELEERGQSISSHLNEGNISISDRLDVYHNNIIGSLSNALCSTFPMIENLTGPDFLKGMAREFIFQHPPTSAYVHHYGSGFDEFIENYAPARDLPYLSDVARLELALNHAYYAEDDDALPADALSKTLPESLGDIVLNFRKSATLISSDYPLLSLRDFCLNGGEAPDLSRAQPCAFLVMRPHLEVETLPLSIDEYNFLNLLQNKTPLGQALEHNVEQHPDFDFPAFLQKHISLETFCTLQSNL